MVERGIGRGLAAILPSASESEESLHEIPVDLIRPNPRQPRGSFDEQALRELAAVDRGARPAPARARAAAGRRRLRADRRRAALARGPAGGPRRVPAIVRASEDSERLELALIENMAREDLNPVEAAHACAALVEELGLTKEEVGRRVGQEPRRDLEPDPAARPARRGAGDARVRRAERGARPRAPAGSRCGGAALARARARDEGLSVRETEALARDGGERGPRGSGAGVTQIPADAEQAVRDVEDALGAALGHRGARAPHEPRREGRDPVRGPRRAASAGAAAEPAHGRLSR